MARQRFRFNKGKMEFSPEDSSPLRRVLPVLKFIGFSLVAALVYYLIFAIFFDNPSDRELSAENKYLRRTYDDTQKKIELLEGVSEDIRMRDNSIYHAIFNCAIPSYALESSDRSDDYSAIVKEGQESMLRQTVEISLRSAAEAGKVSADIDTIISILSKNPSLSGGIPSKVPVENFSVGQTGASVGERINPFFKTLKYHSGMDIVAPAGTAVISPADGYVTQVKRNDRHDGMCLTIDHGGGLTTCYKHLSSLSVSSGQRVKRGMRIASVGSSGRSFASHLHYEVRKDGQPISPVHYFFSDLGPFQYRDVGVLSLITGQSMD